MKWFYFQKSIGKGNECYFNLVSDIDPSCVCIYIYI